MRLAGVHVDCINEKMWNIVGASLSKLIQPVSCQTDQMGARRRLLSPLWSLSPGTGVPGEGLFVYCHVCLMERLQGKTCLECGYICMD